MLGVGVVWLLLLAGLSYRWHRRYHRTLLALSTLQQTTLLSHPILRRHLLAMAAGLLRTQVPTGGVLRQKTVLMAAASHSLHQLAATQWFISPPLWAISFVIMAVALYWMKEGRIAALESERAMLKEQFLAIARGWASLATNPDGRQVMQDILSELAQHTAVNGAAIYRLTGMRSDCLEKYVSLGQLSLAASPIPELFLEPERGLVGEALAANQPRYSGDAGEFGYLIPGVRLPRVAVFPARYRDYNWGVLLLSSDQSGWFYGYRDALEVLAQEVAIAAASADVAEQSRRQQLREERLRMQSDILANVSHELRTPLGLVKGYLETLVESGMRMSTEDRQEFLQVAVAETGELERLIEQLLTMSQVENGKMPHQPEWFRVDPWLSRVLARHPIAARQRIRVGPGYNSARVFGDSRSLATVLSDLLENALKYSAGPIEVGIEVARDWWVLKVRDFGPGVAGGDIDRVFERFYRSPAHAQSEIRGSGLGLSIAKHIVELHDGHIEAANAAGGGFVVSVSLPMIDSRENRAERKEGVPDGRRRVGTGY